MTIHPNGKGFLILIPLLFLTFRSSGQIERAQPGHVFLLDSGKVKMLDRQQLLKRPRNFYFENNESSVQIIQSDTIHMKARVFDNTISPITSVRLYKLQEGLINKRTMPVSRNKVTTTFQTGNRYEGQLKGKKKRKSKKQIYLPPNVDGLANKRGGSPLDGLSLNFSLSTGSLTYTVPDSSNRNVENMNMLSLINYNKLDRIFFKSEPAKNGFLNLMLNNLKPGHYAIKIKGDGSSWNLFDVVDSRHKRR